MDPHFPLDPSYKNILKTKKIYHGYLKCRLVHMKDRSFVLPDILMASGRKRVFYSPQFFFPNCIAFFGGDGSLDFCTLRLGLLGKIDVEVAFFRTRLVKTCADGSFIYKCAFATIDAEALPPPQGTWRTRGNQFELELYHHTTKEGQKGIKSSQKLLSSPWNIQGTQELKNIAYGYFTSIPKIKNTLDLSEVAMAENGIALFLPTNAPNEPQFSVAWPIYKRSPHEIEIPMPFWVDVETISPSHLWLHAPFQEANYYEIVLPKVFRIGVAPSQTIPLAGKKLAITPENCRSFEYVIVGDADTPEGLTAPYHEEETLQIAKIDLASAGTEIIGRWSENQNTHIFDNQTIELAVLNNV